MKKSINIGDKFYCPTVESICEVTKELNSSIKVDIYKHNGFKFVVCENIILDVETTLIGFECGEYIELDNVPFKLYDKVVDRAGNKGIVYSIDEENEAFNVGFESGFPITFDKHGICTIDDTIVKHLKEDNDGK